MYKIYIDNILIHNDTYDALKVDNPELEIELNQPGKLEFTIYPNHPYYNYFSNQFKRMKSIVEVKKDNDLIFRGRILDNDNGFYNEKQVVCEGELAFFIDSTLRPYTLKGTPTECLKYYIDKHNEAMADYPEKQFVMGTVSDLIKDGDTSNEDNIINRSSEENVTTWNEISTKLIESLGGYLIIEPIEVTEEDGSITIKRQINWKHENDFITNTQYIDFGKNLIDIKVNVKGSEIATAIIPVGGSTNEETKERLTIESLEDGVVSKTEDDVIYKKGDYIYSQKGVENYGLIFATRTFDDIVDESYKNKLLQSGLEELENSKKAIESIEIKAVDLYKIKSDSSFKLGTKIKVTTKQHGINGEIFPLTKQSLNLNDPTSNILTLTKTDRTFTETTVTVTKNQSESANVVKRIEKVENNTSGFESQIQANKEAIVATTEEFTSTINQTSQEIFSEVSERYTTKDETETLIAEVKTQVTQKSDEIEIRFTETNQGMVDLKKEVDSQFEEQYKWIRFIDGKIILGEEGSEIILQQQNDRISFIQNGVEIAYISDRKLEIKNAEVTHSFKIGNFAFEPQSNGSLSLKKVT